MPLNFVTHTGVSLASACFANDIFEDSQAEKCISNLLAARYERFIVDLYWDQLSGQFNLCPVPIGSGSPYPESTSAPLANRMLTSQSISGVWLSGESRQPTPVVDSSAARPSIAISTGPGLSVHQSTSTLGTPSPTSQSATTGGLPDTAFTTLSGTTVYKCSSSLNLSFLASLIKSYLDSTSDTLSANLLFLQFNLHAGTSTAESPDSSNPAPSAAVMDLPSQKEIVGNAFTEVIAASVYQPVELSGQRQSLNDSWYAVDPSEQPIAEYFITNNLPGKGQGTPDGWPSEYFVQRRRFNRVLLGWGSITSQMEGDDVTADSDVVFPQNLISSSSEVRTNTTGGIESGCFYNAEKTNVAQSNSSWAVSLVNSSSSLDSPYRLWSLAGNLTSCGITPILNEALGNQTADTNVSPYVQFVQSTIWNWAPGEPRNASIADANSRVNKSRRDQFRCALMETSSTRTTGRWRVEPCEARHRVACRIASQPYLWRLSDNSVPFSAAGRACQLNSSFSVPRTGLENAYLTGHILSLPEDSRSGLLMNGAGVWLNFNSLDAEGCWVTTGPNGSCPHFVGENALRERAVLVPVIAALVVLLLTALTLFVKCNKNRRNSRKKLRGGGGWDYEGVPS